MERFKKIGIACILVAVFLLVGLNMYLNGVFLPKWITWEEKIDRGDFNSDGFNDSVQLENKRVFLLREGAVVDQTPREWQISNYEIADIDKDGQEEIILLLWKRGEDSEQASSLNTLEFSQHVFIYNVGDRELTPKWMSSKLEKNIKNWSVDEDGVIHTVSDDDNKQSWYWKGSGLESVEE